MKIGKQMEDSRLFYANGTPAMCPFTRDQCVSACVFLRREELWYTCIFGNGKILVSNNSLSCPFSEEAIEKMKKEWREQWL